MRWLAIALLTCTALLVSLGCTSRRTAPRATTPAAAAVNASTATTSPTPAPGGAAAAPLRRPGEGRWIDVDVTRFVVRLMDGQQTLREIAPVGVGAQIDTGAYESTQTGVFHVYNKIAGLTYDAPYRTYIDWWVGFDAERANGFHSFLLDASGKVVDASTGRISNGCIRTGDAQAVFTFAEVGMPVLVHV